MVMIVMSEWHEVERRLNCGIDKDVLKAIYPDLKAKEINQLYKRLEAGDRDAALEVVNDAHENGYELEWNHDYDNWYSMNRGGYEVTYSAEADD